MYPSLNYHQQFRLNIINEVKDYFIAKIKERELISKRRHKYIVSFDLFDKPFIALFATSGSISIAPFATAIVAFSITTKILNKLL